MKLNLLENATDYFVHGLQHFEDFSSSHSITDIKQAIVNLVNSIDLFVLEKLRSIDEKAIFINSSSEENYPRRTVHVGTAFKKISDELKGDIDEEEREAYSILKLLRDSAVHHDFSFGEDSENNIYFLLHYIGRFLDFELDIDIKDIICEREYEFYLESIEGMEYSEVLIERAEEARKEMIRDMIYGYEYEAVKNGGESAVLQWSCNECGEITVARDERLDIQPGTCALCGCEHEIAVCFKCEYTIDLSFEGRRMFGDYWCESCYEHWAKQ